MRRAPIVLTATAAGLGAVLSFHPREPSLAKPTATAAASATPTATPSASTSSGTKTATGDAIPTRYGNSQVRVTVENGKITNIEALQLTGDDPKSAQISGSAEPILRQEVLARQTAAVDAVSGATITSGSYEASLQSALDKLGFSAPDGTRAG
jgi:uncharacterized protein with FMN-binding domain